MKRILASLLALLALPAAAQQPAATPGNPRIDDAAKILAPFGPRLGRMIDDFEQTLGIDVHVVSSIDGITPIETQAVEGFKKRQVARHSPTGGVLLVLDPGLRSARIEVGYSLEGVFTDLHMSRVARDQLAPYVSYGAAGMAVMDVLHYLKDYALLAAARGALAIPEDKKKLPDYLRYKKYLSGGAGARTALSSIPEDADLKKAVGGERRARYAPGRTPQESVAAFLRASRDLAGDPTLELFTEGSRLQRARYPFAPFEEIQRLETLEASHPLEYRIEGEFAVATSRKPAHGFVPVLLRREQGLWRVDLVETWKNLFFDGNGKYYQRNSNNPYAFALKQFGNGQRHDIGALPLNTGSIKGDLAALQGRDDALSTLRRAELWLRNAFVFPPALQEYQAALRKAPNDPLVLETYAQRVLYLGFPELGIPALQKIGRGVEIDLAEAFLEMNDFEAASHWVEKALTENPYDGYALEWREYVAERKGDQAALQRARAEAARVRALPGKPYEPVRLYFKPMRPRYDATGTIDVGGTTVYDHSYFGVIIHNTSGREIEIESVRLASKGDAAASGLGDIKDYWKWDAGARRLRADESRYFERHWGFTVNTKHSHVRYVFHTCWHGVNDAQRVRQCSTQWVDTLP
jgi:tetratricopeptide (TPR) repeat protein